jgi:transposase
MLGWPAARHRGQSTLLPASLDDYVSEDNPVRVVDVFVDSLNLDKLGFVGVQPLETGRPSYHPGMMLKLYIYGYLHRLISKGALKGQRSSILCRSRQAQSGPGTWGTPIMEPQNLSLEQDNLDMLCI